MPVDPNEYINKIQQRVKANPELAGLASKTGQLRDYYIQEREIKKQQELKIKLTKAWTNSGYNESYADSMSEVYLAHINSIDSLKKPDDKIQSIESFLKELKETKSALIQQVYKPKNIGFWDAVIDEKTDANITGTNFEDKLTAFYGSDEAITRVHLREYKIQTIDSAFTEVSQIVWKKRNETLNRNDPFSENSRLTNSSLIISFSIGFIIAAFVVFYLKKRKRKSESVINL